jgi:hypothetical protein
MSYIIYMQSTICFGMIYHNTARESPTLAQYNIRFCGAASAADVAADDDASAAGEKFFAAPPVVVGVVADDAVDGDDGNVRVVEDAIVEAPAG